MIKIENFGVFCFCTIGEETTIRKVINQAKLELPWARRLYIDKIAKDGNRFAKHEYLVKLDAPLFTIVELQFVEFNYELIKTSYGELNELQQSNR